MKKQISELALIFVLCAVSVVLLSSCNKAKTDSGVTSAPAANSTSSTTKEQEVKTKNNIIIYNDEDLINADFLIRDGDNITYDDKRTVELHEKTGILPKIVETGVDGYYNYAIHEDGYAQILKYNGNEEDIVIPDMIAGYPVAYIGSAAFEEKDPGDNSDFPEEHYKIRSVVMPDTVLSIGGEAFYGCKNLKSLKLSDNLFCIASIAFAQCESLENMALPESLQYVGWETFENTGLTEVTISSNFKDTGCGAFSDCKKLKKIQFEGGDIAIDGIISGSGVEELYIPANLNIQGNGAMFCSENLKRVEYAEKMDKDTIVYAEMYRGCTNLEEIKLPSNITKIQEYAFQGCRRLKEIHIPKSVKSIETWAFTQCNSLRDVYFESKDCEGIEDTGLSFKFRKIHAPSGGNIEEFCKDTLTLTFVPTD